MNRTPCIRKALFVFTAFLSMIFLLWRAKYGYCFQDEPFLVSLAQRLFQGDALIADEWHGTQNFGVILLPFYALFRLFSPNNEGILMVFRYTYCFLWWLCCLFVSKCVVSKTPECPGQSGYCRHLVFLYLVLFSPLDYMTLSYTSVGLMSCLLLCCQLYRLSDAPVRNAAVPAGLFSLLWILLTLCSPFMAPVYLLFVALSAAGAALEKRRCSSFYFCNLWRISRLSLLYVALVVPVYLLLFVFSRADISRVLDNLPYLFMDPQHEQQSFVKALLSAPVYVLKENPLFVLSSFLVFSAALVKNLCKYRLPLFSVCTLLFINAQLIVTRTVLPGHELLWPLLNYQMMYIAVLGAVAFALLEKRPYTLFLLFNGFGWAYAAVLNATSNTQLKCISMALAVAGVSGIVCIVALLHEMAQQYRARKVLRALSVLVVCLSLTVQLGTELCTRFNRTYWDKTFSALTAEIQYGSAKGIRTTPEQAAAHDRVYENLTQLLSRTDTEGKHFLCTAGMPHLYLDADLDFAVFSGWNLGYTDEYSLNDRIVDYQKINPGSRPDIIFCPDAADILPFIDSSYHRIEYRGSYLFFR